MYLDTLAIHGGQKPDPVTGAIAPPIVTSQNGAFRHLEDPIQIEYARTGNPIRETLEDLVAELEGGGEGFAFASGIAAINCLFFTLNKGDHAIFGNNLYSGIVRSAHLLFSKFLEVDFVDLNDTATLEKTIQPTTKYIFAETPSNPLLRLVDLEKLQEISLKYKVPYIIDSTFATPYLLKPFDYGAETVIHSTSKYLSGHHDLLGGVLVTKNKELAEKLKLYSKTLGAIPSPYDIYNTIRGIKTLALRVEKQCKSAEKIARFLEEKVDKVYYPGLPSHPDHDIAKKQMKGYGGVIAFEVGGDYRAFAKNIANQDPPIITLAESFGSVNSFLSHPPTMSHAYLGPEGREKAGIKDNLFRLSAGIENVDDIIESLDNALRYIGRPILSYQI